MESPAIARYIPQKSKKRVFPGSSSSCMDPEVVEISPPIHWSSNSKSLKQKEVIYHEVINVDMDDDSDSVVLIDEDIDSSKNGKQLADIPFNNMAMTGAVDGVQSSNKTAVLGAHNSFDMEVADHDFLFGDDDFMDLYDDDVTYDDEYAFLQAQFDSIDIPPGVEAPIPWFSAPALNKKEVTAVYSSNHPSSMGQLDANGIDLSHSGGLPELVQPGKNWTSLSCSSSQTQVGTRQLYGTELSSFWPFPESSSNKKKSAGSTSSNHMSSHVETGACSFSSRLKPWYAPGYSRSKRKPSDSGSAGDYTSHNHLGSVGLTSGMYPSSKRSFLSKYQKKFGRDYLNYSTSSATGTSNLPPGVNPLMSGGKGSLALPNQSSFMSDVMFQESSDAVHLFPEKEMDVHGIQNTAKSSTVPTGSMSSIKNHVNRDDIMKNFQLFKQFDTVEEHSDHHYASKGSSVKRPSKNWAKRIQEEWRILEKDLPDTIFVRVYESRMDLLRAVIVGAEETPYHDGLFFFDVFFPCGYPNVPPHVYYHSGGLRINPNLYNCGKVCLSLLNTWSGSQNEKWIPGVSTMLQVLVSIQALILNEKPYFNEPGYARMGGTASGEKNSEQYNEKTFILSLKTMVYTMRRPPKHFGDFVFGHFCNRAQDILVACKAYMDGAQVGCLAKGGVQDVDAGDKSCSLSFKGTLASHITMLVEAFIQIGAKDCEKFLPLAKKGNGLVKSGLMPALFT